MDFEPVSDNKNILMTIGGLVLVLALLIGTSTESTDEELDQQQYCEMVRAHMKDKETGWPDFNGNYKEVCEGEQK